VVVEGTGGGELRKGPGHYPGTALPGRRGTVAIAGHRVTHGRPFRNLHRVRNGDVVLFRARSGKAVRYRVFQKRVIRPTEVWVLGGRTARRLVLTACHPPGSARFRLVVFARQIPATARGVERARGVRII
jgi:sortase A